MAEKISLPIWKSISYRPAPSTSTPKPGAATAIFRHGRPAFEQAPLASPDAVGDGAARRVRRDVNAGASLELAPKPA